MTRDWQVSRGVAVPVERGPLGWEEGGSRAPAGPVPGSMWPRSDRCWLHACTDGDRHRWFWTLWLQPPGPLPAAPQPMSGWWGEVAYVVGLASSLEPPLPAHDVSPSQCAPGYWSGTLVKGHTRHTAHLCIMPATLPEAPLCAVPPVPMSGPIVSPHTHRDPARHRGRPRCAWARGRFGRARAGESRPRSGRSVARWPSQVQGTQTLAAWLPSPAGTVHVQSTAAGG